MTDVDLAAEELTLVEIQKCERSAALLVEQLQLLPASRHLSIAIAGIESAGFRIKEEKRVIAGRVMAAKQADPSNFP